MNYNIKDFLVISFLLLSLIGHSQDADINEEKPTEEGSEWSDDHYLNFTIGIYNPIAFGENFSSKGLRHSPGFDFNGMVNLGKSKVLVGLHYSIFGSNVVDKELVGDYNRSTISKGGPVIGYHFLRTPKIRASISLGYGVTRYHNAAGIKRFNDLGNSIWLTPSFQYHFNKTLGLYFSASYSRDSLNIVAPEEVQEFFNSTQYFNLSTGLSIIL